MRLPLLYCFLSLSKINETFKDMSEDMVSLITSVIREVKMTRCERIIDYIEYINNYDIML